MRTRTSRHASAIAGKLTVLRPELIVAVPTDRTVPDTGQPPLSATPVPVLAIRSTVTSPLKLLNTALPVELRATRSRLNVVPAVLVRITPVTLPLAVLVSKALKPPGAEPNEPTRTPTSKITPTILLKNLINVRLTDRQSGFRAICTTTQTINTRQNSRISRVHYARHRRVPVDFPNQRRRPLNRNLITRTRSRPTINDRAIRCCKSLDDDVVQLSVVFCAPAVPLTAVAELGDKLSIVKGMVLLSEPCVPPGQSRQLPVQ